MAKKSKKIKSQKKQNPDIVLFNKVARDMPKIVKRDLKAGLAQQKLIKEKFVPLVLEILRKQKEN